MKRQSPPEGTLQSAPSHGLTLRLLGEPSLWTTDAEGVERRLLGVGKPLALLTYLAVAPQREASREFLADLLWAGGSVADPAHSLRNALVSLRNGIGPDLLEATASRCRLTHPIPNDLEELAGALRDGRLRDVLTLYTGEFFAGFAAPGCLQFEHWSESVRHRVRTDVANAADVLVRQLLDAGHARDAADVARRMADIEPLGQRSRRALIEALVAAGDNLGALTEVAVLEQWLDAEGLETEPATATLISTVRKGRPSGRAADSDGRAPRTPDLVGREAEFAEILVAWERAKAGGPAYVAVTAAAGVGKSRLLVDVGNRLRAERARVIAVGALQGERDLPFALLAAIVGAIAPLVESRAITPGAARVLAALDPALAERYETTPDLSATDLVLRRALALRELLVSAAERKATALILDDMHWADESSADVILAALTRLADSPLLVVASARPGRRLPLPVERTTTLALPPLSVEQFEQLVASIRPLPAAAWARTVCRALHASSAGVPLFGILALRSAEDAGLLIAGEQEWECENPAALTRSLTHANVASQSLRDLTPTALRALARLALAGRELPWSLLADSLGAGGASDMAWSVAELERRALATRHGDRVVIAHDLVADAVLDAVTPDDRRQWSRELAREMIATGRGQWLERGVRLAATAATPAEIAAMLTPALRKLPVTPGQSLRLLVGGWLGQTGEQQAMATRVARRLPLGVRLRPFRRRIMAAVAVVLLASVAVSSRFARAEPTPDAVLRVISVTEAGQTQAFDAPLFLGQWNAAKPLQAVRTAAARDSGQVFGQPDGSRVSLTARARLVEQVFDDSGGSDVTRIDASGARQRLTSFPGDDIPGGWAPDGRFVTFNSSRWSERRHHRLARLDVATGAIRPLGRGEGLEGGGQWSPDGSRIAFQRTYLDARPSEICTADADGTDESCTTGLNGAAASLIGWADATRVFVTITEPSGNAGVWTLVPDSGWATRVVVPNAHFATLAPNGRFLAWRESAQRQSRLRVAPVADVGRSRTVNIDTEAGSDGTLTWSVAGLPSPYVESLAIRSPTDTVVVGVPHRPFLKARWSDGSAAKPPHVHWSIAAGNDVVVDALGTMLASRPGAFEVRASAGGWRTATRRFVAVARTSEVLSTERWSQGTTRWRLFGDPRPRVVRDAQLGLALSNEGDGTYFSGAYRSLPPLTGRGLAVDAVVRTPITELQWQSLNLNVMPLANPEELARWDHRSGYIPNVSTTDGLASCGVEYPRGDGLAARRKLFLHGDEALAREYDAQHLERGNSWRIRIQIFPDGRCGVAVNGEPLFSSKARLSVPSAPLLVTYGNSWHSRMLLGPITVSNGVPHGVDWSRTLRAPVAGKRQAALAPDRARHAAPRPPR